MSKHQGQTVEKVLRRGGYSLSEVAGIMNVNRRSIYNWFNQAALRPEVIYQIGHGILHDFSVEFPEFFKPADFVFKTRSFTLPEDYKRQAPCLEEVSQWKQKYLELYPRYKKLLNPVSQTICPN
jgi:hypothetical protein